MAEAALRKAIQIAPGYGEAHSNLAVIYATQQPPFVELARWHYQKALASGLPQNPEIEKFLDPKSKLDAVCDKCSDDRKDKVDFSDSYMTSQMLMMVRGDESRFTDAKSFADNPELLMAAQPGTTPVVPCVQAMTGRGAPPDVPDTRTSALATAGRSAVSVVV